MYIIYLENAILKIPEHMFHKDETISSLILSWFNLK